MAALALCKWWFGSLPKRCVSNSGFRQFYLSFLTRLPKVEDTSFYNKSKVFEKSAVNMSELNPIKYPEAAEDSTSDNYFGVDVKDPYRWLENPDSRETKAFIDRQNVITKKFLSSCPHRKSINESLKKIWDYPKYSCPFREGQMYFFFMNTGLQNQSALYIQKDLKAEPSLFLDPNTLSEDGTVALSATEFSEDGSTLAYGLSYGGSDWMTIQFKDVQTKEDYPEVLTRVKFSSISWTHDNKGIFYAMYPMQNPNVQENLETQSDQHQKLYYHRLGTSQSEDVLVLEFPDEPKFRILTDVSDCGRYLIVYLQKGCRDNLVYFCDFERINYKITGKLPLTQIVHKLEADYEYITNTGPEFIFRTNKNASNYRLIKINFENPEEDSWITLIKENPVDVLDWAIAVNKNKLLICYMRHVQDVLQYHELSDGRLIHTLPLGVGTIVGISGKKKLSEIFYKVASFVTPGIIYRCELNNPNFLTEIHKEVKLQGFDRNQYQTTQIFYPSKDGTKIPMFIVHGKDLEKNSANPCLLYGYGGFNISIKPYFSVTMAVFLKHFNGVLAFPNIRGGGEYGDKWHNQGRFENKQNTFDDFQAAAEYLIKNKYTSSKQLIIKGESSGGLTVVTCAVQRPDLFGAVLAGGRPQFLVKSVSQYFSVYVNCAQRCIPTESGSVALSIKCNAQGGNRFLNNVLDMLRFHKFTIGSAWVSDYGCSDIEDQFQYLYKYSPLHNITVPPENVQFPALLLTTADRDDRVVPFHSLKFIATLQRVMKNQPQQKNPLLIRVDVKAGHGAGKPTSKLIEEATDLLCFVLQSLNLQFHP